MHQRENDYSEWNPAPKFPPPFTSPWEGSNSVRSSARHPPPERDPTLVHEIMTRNPYCASPDTSLDELVQNFLDRSISGAPVIDGTGRLLGTVRKSDLLRPTGQNAALGEHDANTPPRARDLMGPAAFCLPHTASVSQAAALMAYEEVHQIPIIDNAGLVVGMVSSLDVMRWMARREGYLIP